MLNNSKISLRFGAAASLGVIAVLALIQPACSENTSPPAEGPKPAEKVVIGVAISLSGEGSEFGVGLRDSLLVAERTINSGGKVLGRDLEFRIVDDADEQSKAAEAVNGLLNEGVAGILGPQSSSLVLATQDLTFRKKVVQISASATSTLLTHIQPTRDRYLFRTVSSDTMQGVAIARLLYDGIEPLPGKSSSTLLGGNCRRAAIVNADDGYGNALADTIRAKFITLPGAQFVLDEKVKTNAESNYTDLVGRIVAQKPDCLALIAYTSVSATFLRDLKKAIAAQPPADAAIWAKFFVSGCDGQYASSFTFKGQKDPADPLSENSSAGVIGTAPDSSPDTPEYSVFRNLYQAVYPGKEPDPHAAHQYDAAILLALAIQKAGTTTDGVKIRDALFEVSKGGQLFGPADYAQAVGAIKQGGDVDYKGAAGAVDFDDDGEVIGDYLVWQVVKQPAGTYAFETVAKIKADVLK